MPVSRSLIIAHIFRNNSHLGRHFCTKPPPKQTFRAGIVHGKTTGSKGLQGNSVGSSLCDGKFNWLDKHAPQFFIRGDQVQVITEPTQFYEVLKLKTRKAKKRVTYASLYLGNGHLEEDLVSCIREACETAAQHTSDKFQVNILLDSTRGSRGKKNSRTMLRPLLTNFPNVHVALYHTPDLRGILKKVVPDRFNETIGLTHVKVYLFDDSFIISGANLSHDYFTNRQDRYILFNDCPELADFFQALVKAIMSFSLQLSPDDSLLLAPDWRSHPFKDSDDGSRFKISAREKIESLLKQSSSPGDMTRLRGEKNSSEQQQSKVSNPDADTVIYPLIQMGPFGIKHDEAAMLDLLRLSEPSDHILLATGYFNLTDLYSSSILDEARAKFNILLASPKANGFLGAKGVAGAIPYSYIYLAHQFHNRVTEKHHNQRIHMLEYERDGWTFHGKGLWYYLPSQALPSMTLVGSPNFGFRSVQRDLECQLAVVTTNPSLREQLRQEHVHMYATSQPVTEQTFQKGDRHVPLWVRLTTYITKHFF